MCFWIPTTPSRCFYSSLGSLWMDQAKHWTEQGEQPELWQRERWWRLSEHVATHYNDVRVHIVLNLVLKLTNWSLYTIGNASFESAAAPCTPNTRTGEASPRVINNHICIAQCIFIFPLFSTLGLVNCLIGVFLITPKSFGASPHSGTSGLRLQQLLGTVRICYLASVLMLSLPSVSALPWCHHTPFQQHRKPFQRRHSPSVSTSSFNVYHTELAYPLI